MKKKYTPPAARIILLPAFLIIILFCPLESAAAARKEGEPSIKTSTTSLKSDGGLSKESLKTIRTKLSEGKKLFSSKKYPDAMEIFMEVLLIDPANSEAKNLIKKSADKILEPEKKRIEAERRRIMAEYKKYMAKRKVESPESIYSAIISNYNKKRYIKAYEGIKKLAAISPGYKNVSIYETNITNEMKELSSNETYPDAEALSYAKGFDAYFFKNNLETTAREWDKVITLNPRRTEVLEYLKTIKDQLADAERARRIAELTRLLEGYYNSGENEFANKKYVQSIKEWEKIVETVKKEKDFPDGTAWETKARDAINRALEEIDKMAKAKPATPVPAKPAAKPVEAPKPEVIDEAAAARYYQEGLVSYAQGRLRDAIRSWDLALRMNPNHDKARKAKEKAEAELQAGR